MNLTSEQSSILGAAFSKGRDLAIATAIDSQNDMVWLALVDKGVLEHFEPTGPEMVELGRLAQLRFYRPTEKALARANFEPTADGVIFQIMGNA